MLRMMMSSSWGRQDQVWNHLLRLSQQTAFVHNKQCHPHARTPVLKDAQPSFADTTAKLQLHGMDLVCCSMSRANLFLMRCCLHVLPCFTEHVNMTKAAACIH